MISQCKMAATIDQHFQNPQVVKNFILDQQKHKKGLRCPKCGDNSQNASHNFCSNCGERLAPISKQISVTRDAELTSALEMEPKAESIPSLDSCIGDQPVTEYKHSEPEASVSESPESEGWVLHKKAVKVNSVDWSKLDKDDSSPSKKRKREEPDSYEGSKPYSRSQQKKKKKNKKNKKCADSELLVSLTSFSSSAQSSLDCSLIPQMADANNLLKESQYENDEVTKPETGECQIKRPSSSDIDPSPEVVAENDNSTVVIKDEFEQENKNVAAQHAGAVGPGEKMEESIKTANLFCAQIPSKEQSSKRSIETAPTLENAPLVQGEVPFVSTGSTEKITLDSRSKMEPAKNARTNLDAVHQNQVTKRSLLKSETLQSLKTKVEHETKQQNASKKAKLDEQVSKQERELGTLERKTTQMEDFKEKRKPPAVSNRNQQTEPKNKKQQPNNENSTIKQSQVNFGDRITVYFHAILSKDFKLNPEKHKVVIRAEGISGYANWRDNICELTSSKVLDDHGHLIEGWVAIPKDHIAKSIPYKYIVLNGSKTEYEFIYKHHREGIYVNRCLFIPHNLLHGTDWHQYDDIICKKFDGIFNRLWSSVQRVKDHEKTVVRGKQIAARVMLDSLFSLLKTWTPSNIINFFRQLEQFYFVYHKPMVDEAGSKEWKSLEFGEKQLKELLLEYLREKAKPLFNQDEANCSASNKQVQNKLGLALIFLLIGERFKIPKSKNDLTHLCSLLCLEKLPADVQNEIHCFKEMFSRIFCMEHTLTTLCKECIEQAVHQWLWTIPVLHLFSASIESECVKMNNPLESEERWAGLKDLAFVRYRNLEDTSGKLLTHMKEKKHLLEDNRMLFRAWFSLLPLTELAEFITEFPIDPFDCLIGTFHRLKSEKIRSSKCEVVENLLTMVLRALCYNENSTLWKDIWSSFMTVCQRLHVMLCDKIKCVMLYKIPVASADLVSRILSLSPLEVSREMVNVFHRLLTNTRGWFRQVLTEPLLQTSADSKVKLTIPHELEAWDHFLEINFHHEEFTEEWQKTLTEELAGRMKQEGAVQRIQAYCCWQAELEKLHPLIGKAFENCAIDAIHSACQAQSNLLDMISFYDLRKLSKLVSAVITQSWPTNSAGNDMEHVLNHLLVWPDAKKLFIFSGGDGSILDSLTDEAKEIVGIAETVYMDFFEQLQTGSILVKCLELILKHKKQFLSIWELKCKHFSSEEKTKFMLTLEKVLELRQEEVITVKREQKWLGCFLDMCRKVEDFVKVDLTELEESYSENLTTKTLEDIVDVRELNTQSDDDLETYYQLSADLKEMSETMHRFKESHIFQYCWMLAAKLASDSVELSEEEDNTILEPDGVLDYLYHPCFKEFHRLYNSLKSGELTFAEVGTLFKDFINHYEELRKDFLFMCDLVSEGNRQWVNRRIEQIQQYHELHLAVDSAKIIDKVKEGLRLTGDFNVLVLLLNFRDEFQSFQQQKLSCMNSELVHAKKLLQSITEPRRRCLEELTHRMEFVNWVREALKDINELKVFVDLASISAGENDMDVDRVACFHDAVLGYSCLLYELKQESRFEEFMMCLEKLWKALESDCNLPKKLRDSARYLEWLKTVKESHGSVELSSISLATTINSKGIYVIKAPAEGQKVSLDTILCLIISENHDGQEEERRYSLEELRELMNKLMLMSGKVEQNAEVEKFSEIFSSVQRLALSFIDLHSAGNMLFRTWTANVCCSGESMFCIRMDFNLGPLFVLSGKGEVTDVLPAICRKMESFLTRWDHFISDRRSQYIYLNYYNAEQLVYLCRELGSKCPSKAALMMLSLIKRDCSEDDVQEVSKRMVSIKPKKNLADLFALVAERELTEHLEYIWASYMENMHSFLPGCLDIDTLGSYLSILAGLEKRSIQRVLPSGLNVGKPNLILCPRSEVLTSALAIYMNSPEEMLPSYDEILLCTPQTSYEQVALFLRRCLTPGCQEKKIYTLLFADELSYNVGYRSEELFRSLHLKYWADYHLVIMCNCEREHCYVPSVFSQFKIHMIPQQPLKSIQNYLVNHYKATDPAISLAPIFKKELCVSIISSKRAAVGKSLYVKRLHEKMEEKLNDTIPLKTIRLLDPCVDESKVLKSLLPFLDHKDQKQHMIFHFDITSSVHTGIPEFLFNLLVLQCLTDAEGKLWLRNQCHLYVIEILEVSPSPKKQIRSISCGLKYKFLDMFPKIMCRTPKEVLEMESLSSSNHGCSDPGMDWKEFCSEAFQRPFQYLRRFNVGNDLDTFEYEEGSVEGTPAECLQLFLIHCGVIDPSWSELRNFACFLNIQLKNCETSVFCKPCFVQDTLQGFKHFVVTFMILMARDFATPSLHICDESPGSQVVDMKGVTEEDLTPFRIRKKWESEPHPYIFFNEDGVSMTFIGFHLQANADGSIDAINPLNGLVIKRNVMSPQLYQGLNLQKVPFNVNFDALPRHEKIEKLCTVLGNIWPIDPDETYELTTDNILKILAIEMRFRCGIPVVIMGETGCGKTRLIKFLCELRRCGADTENMKLVKVHGGTSAEAIYSKVREAECIATINKKKFKFDTILFFDEANTTEAVGCIKEVLCDHTVEGQPLVHNSGLQVIAACNPYRKHTEKMIQRLESAGLGYRVKAEETKDRLGSIPLRQLVYRVHALPPSMIPLVWDFGQLNSTAEKLYIQQIVQRLTGSIQIVETDIKRITEVLFESQSYMRQRNDECSFISLRDVERCVEVFKWFYKNAELLTKHLEKFVEKKTGKVYIKKDVVIWCLVLSVGVCYHASLENKEWYRGIIAKLLPEPFDSRGILEEINLIQDLFLNGVPLRETIARNLALKENVFMMVICIELKIPLFLIGKPGSSKSLAKTIVADAMQGHAAYSELYKELKQIHLVSFQCSPHSTPEGIINTFKHCARFQEGKNLKEYVSVVVLDEIGLAEDSPKMPLKTLHPLLEDGCIDDDPLPHKKVGFIGISNWALDPAKMNRGIFVSRGNPNTKELIESAKGICSSEHVMLQKIEHFFPIFANAYDEICKTQDKEFFGLRDYYSLIKMIFALTKTSEKEPAARDIAEIVLHNFSGKEGVKALDIFMSKLPEKGDVTCEDINTIDLIQRNICSGFENGECRYLLVLTQNYAALQILQQEFFKGTQQPEIIFGSSFPKDQEYTQICRNINRVKICMETGRTVILLNLQNLYESLYDALNQYYVQLAGQKYVDLGLGTHRVKCRVHSKFHLIVIEEKEVVYKHFPIPLINRLEKHYLDINTVLVKWQRDIVEDLKKWVNNFIAVDVEKYFMGQQKYSPSDVFIGYHSDTCASVVLQVTEKLKNNCSLTTLMQKVPKKAQLVLLNCATLDSVIRLGNSQLASYLADDLARVYFQQQQHISLAEFLQACLHTESMDHTIFTEITTFSRLLTPADTETLEREIQGNIGSVKVLFLQQFDTEYSFLKEIRNFLDATPGNKILIVQTDFENGRLSAQLVASAKYSAVNEINKIALNGASVFVFFITKLSRVEGGSSYVGFHGGLWQSVHIDDLRKSKDMVSDVNSLRNITISQLFSEDIRETARNSEPLVVDAEKEEEMAIQRSAATKPDQWIAVPGKGQVLDTTILLRTCVQSAVGMLRDQNEGASRSTKRIEILLSLLSEDDDLKASFLKITKSRLLNLLRKQEESSYAMKEWVLREASNINSLQEAGTFRHTLWKRVQSVVTPFLAYMVSVLDRDSNLELLVSSTTEICVKNLWMFIFNDLNFLNIPYDMIQNSSQSETILIQNCFANASNEMPFSWKIKDYLEDLWVQAQYITGNEGHAEKFVDIFQNTPLGKYITGLSEEERGILFHCYVRDFLLLAMGVSCPEELKLLQMALLSGIEEMKTTSFSAGEGVLPLPWIHLSYHQFRCRLQNFSRILAVHPDVFRALTSHSWTGGDILHNQMVLDILAAMACTEMLEEKMLQCKPQTWLQQVKNVRMPVELVCTANYLQTNGSQSDQLLHVVRSRWNRIFAVSLFVEHVLLGADREIPEVEDLVKRNTLLLSKCFQWDSDIKTHTTFTAVLKVLCQCKEDASSAFCRYGLKPCPICLGDPNDPVVLPCDHVYCQTCIKQWLVPGHMLCPYCLVDLPDGYTLTASKEFSIIVEKNAQFRKFCNSFFIDLISTMCFKDNEPPEKAVIQELLKLLFVHKKLLRGGKRGSDNRCVHTKSLSPFDDVVDKTPVIRSVVLKLLLKYSFNEVKDYLQEYLSQVEESQILETEDKTELYILFVNCLEDSMCEKLGAASAADKATYMKQDEYFLTNYLQNSSQEINQECDIEYLQRVAQIRLCLDRAAELLFELHGTANGSKEMQNLLYLPRMKHFCRQNDWYKIYLVRKLTNQYGMEFVERLLSERQCNWIFPSEVIREHQRNQLSQIDRFLVYGKSYRVVRNALGRSMIRCQMDATAAALKASNGSKSAQAVHCLLAVFRELTSLYGCMDPNLQPKQMQCDILKAFIQKLNYLKEEKLQTFAQCLVANTLSSVPVSPQNTSHEKVVIEMAVHAASVLLCGQNRILGPLRNLAFSPSTMQKAFLPTMPEDMLAQAVKWQGTSGLHWYTCQNGHPCTIGECGRPMERSKCIDCGAQIGGENHNLLKDFHAFQFTGDRTQTGHVLGDPRNRDIKVASEREMSPAVLILIRLLTHLALFLGASNDPQSLLQIIKTQVQDPVSFLLQHIHKDLEQLMNTLGKSSDETTNVVHLILSSLLKESPQHRGQEGQVNFDDQLSEKQYRNNWEGIVANTIIVPELKLLDETLLELNRKIGEDERISSSPIVKIIYGDPATSLSSLPRSSTVHCSKMWSCRKRISIEHLGHIVQQKDAKDAVPILWKFLQKEAELRLVKFLPEILTLQRDLVKRFQNLPEVELTIGDFLNSVSSESKRILMKNRVKTFMCVWNKLRKSLENNGEIKLPQGYCDSDLTLDKEFAILLPRRRGLGLCSTALVSYLISLHNDLVYTIEKYTTNAANRYQVSPAEVADLHVITYEVERDLIPLILSNCQYSVEKGRDTLQEFDLKKIQEQVTSRFLQGKPLITLTGIPTLVYRHDRNYEHLFNDIKSKLDQCSLPNSTIGTISGELQSYSDVCAALSFTEITLGFLAMAGGESENTLTEYLENVLQMGSQISDHVMKALSHCRVKHTIALWQLLSNHKSEQLLHLKRDPFADVDTSYKAELTAENSRLLNTFLSHGGLETFLQEVHEMIILKLKHAQRGDEFNPTWSLKDTLISYLERKDSNIPGELMDMFPEEIPLSQCVAAWRAAAALKQVRILG